MLHTRSLFVAITASVSGAMLITLLVMSRGGQPDPLTWDTLQTEGGVLWMHTESYERPASGRESNLRSERTLTDTWTRVMPGDRQELVAVGQTPEGVTLGRGQFSEGDFSNDLDPALAAPLALPLPRGSSAAMGDAAVSCEDGQEWMVGERHGTFMCVGAYPRPATGSASNAYQPAYPTDLDVVTVQQELRFNANGDIESMFFRALLDDGSHVLISSVRFHFSFLPLSEWDEIRATVFGESVGTG